MNEITYHAIVGQGPFREVLVTRRDQRAVSQVETGVIYKTWREALKALEAKNAIRK